MYHQQEPVEEVKVSRYLVRKTCPRCGQGFEREQNRPSGGNPYCLTCRQERTYGLSVGQYDLMLLDQQNRCAVCGRHVSELNHRLYVDHDHVTDEVRGLLCRWCNSVVAWFEEHPDRIDAVGQYLEGKEKVRG